MGSKLEPITSQFLEKKGRGDKLIYYPVFLSRTMRGDLSDNLKKCKDVQAFISPDGEVSS